ncbi:hypothetical protein PPACK8108_LOCUS8802 [Phakopsora pachyrhizi]|uniref:Uncharacterized protein n=1 Tax=Phakopsora pachyrhizi TaxID=170000 RepID=A0AAV0AV96_PHAPC|nr:hypothetical protein PPACK8108_LOCUS8802 [Phakopsora pachyrhizi]
MRKAESIRRRNDAMNGISKITTKKGLIRQMSMKTFSQAANNGEMRWNEEDVRWEGNEQVLREFDNVLSSSSRPALISQLSIQSPVIQSPGSEDFGGNLERWMEKMSWRSREVDGEDELLLESDEELEMRWQADDEGSNTGGVGVDLAQSEWNDSGRLIDRGDDEVKQEGKFWDDCVEAEIRHLKEITPHPPNCLFSHEYQHHRPAPILTTGRSQESSQPSRGFSAWSPNLLASISSSSYSDLNASPAVNFLASGFQSGNPKAQSMALISSEIRVGVMRMIRVCLVRL